MNTDLNKIAYLMELVKKQAHYYHDICEISLAYNPDFDEWEYIKIESGGDKDHFHSLDEAIEQLEQSL